MKLSIIMKFLGDLVTSSFTGRVIFDFHEGNISKRIKKEIVEILE